MIKKINWVVGGCLVALVIGFPLSVYAQVSNHVATGVVATGADGITGRSSGDNAEVGGTLAIHSAYAEYSEESYFVGFSLVEDQTAPGGEKTDMGMFGGLGVGRKGNSLELTLTVADVSDFKDFLFSAKYQFLEETPTRPAMAVGVEGINEIPEQLERSPYIVASKFFFNPRVPLILSLGWGSGRFNDSFFGALALILSPSWSLIVEYDGLGGNVGTSFLLPLPGIQSPCVLTLGIQDAFWSDYDSTFTLAGGIRFR